MQTGSFKTLLVAVLVVLVAASAGAANIRYKQSGDWFALEGVDGNGWQSASIPGPADTARFNWGGNTVTLAGDAGTIGGLQAGVDESGTLIINDGGSVVVTGNIRAGNNNSCTGTIIVNSGGYLEGNNWAGVAFNTPGDTVGVLTVDGGMVDINSHLWIGDDDSPATIVVSNGGVIDAQDAIAIGRGVAPCTMTVGNGSEVHARYFDGGIGLIGANSSLSLEGSGTFTLQGNRDVAPYMDRIYGDGVAGNVTVTVGDYLSSGTRTVLTVAPALAVNPSSGIDFSTVDFSASGGVTEAYETFQIANTGGTGTTVTLSFSSSSAVSLSVQQVVDLIGEATGGMWGEEDMSGVSATTFGASFSLDPWGADHDTDLLDGLVNDTDSIEGKFQVSSPRIAGPGGLAGTDRMDIDFKCDNSEYNGVNPFFMPMQDGWGGGTGNSFGYGGVFMGDNAWHTLSEDYVDNSNWEAWWGTITGPTVPSDGRYFVFGVRDTYTTRGLANVELRKWISAPNSVGVATIDAWIPANSVRAFQITWAPTDKSEVVDGSTLIIESDDVPTINVDIFGTAVPVELSRFVVE